MRRLRATAVCVLALAGATAAPAEADAATGGLSYGGASPAPAQNTGGAVPGHITQTSTLAVPAPTPVPAAHALLQGRVARPPQSAPTAVRRAISAANSLQDKPYLYGGGHASFVAKAYDCSAAVSFALHGAGLLSSPLASPGLMTFGLPGPGRWITIFANPGHAYVLIAGLRLDTSGSGQRGPRWRSESRSNAGFTLRHPAGL